MLIASPKGGLLGYNDLNADDVHLINDWFEQEVELGVVSQGCVVVVGKVCGLPVWPSR